MHINRISYSPSHTGIYRLHGQFDEKELMFGVIQPYMTTHHRGVAIINGENPYSYDFKSAIDEYLQEYGYSKSWLAQNAKNHNLHQLAEELDSDVISIITKDEDAQAMQEFISNNEIDKKPTLKEKILRKFNIYDEETIERSKIFNKLPDHLRVLFAKFNVYKDNKEAFDEALKDRIVDVNSTKELLVAMMKESL